MTDNTGAAMEIYHSMLQYISTIQCAFGSSLEHRTWTEKLLHNYCILVGSYVASKAHRPEELLSPTAMVAPASILAPFRAWASFCETEPDYGGSSRPHSEAPPPRRRLWQAYYDTLSLVLKISPRSSAISNNHNSQFQFASKAAQSAELRKVETRYESLLLQEVGFPKANEANPEVETWTDQVMTNWSIISAPESLDEDLEKGGRLAVSHRVLDVGRLLTQLF